MSGNNGDNDNLQDDVVMDDADPVENTSDGSEAQDRAGDEGEVDANTADDQATDELAPQEQMERLEQQLADAKDQTLRTQAEMQNLRRRAERDVANAHKFGLEKLVNGLLPVLDNLDRAIGAVNGDAIEGNEEVKALLEGVELTRKSAVDVLGQFAVEVVEPHGEPFDPQLHEAITMVPSPTVEPNSVVDVLQKGYTLNGRLLRAAMVVVSKAD